MSRKKLENEDNSYKRYRQYRRNKYRYELDQMLFPVATIIIGAIAISIWKQLLITLIFILLIIVAYFIAKSYYDRQMRCKDNIKISSNEALCGTCIDVVIKNLPTPLKVSVEIPPNTKDGEIIVVKSIETVNSQGKKVKKNLHLRIEVDKSI